MECIDDFQHLMNVYYIISLIMGVMACSGFAIYCIISRHRDKKKAKKGPVDKSKSKDSIQESGMAESEQENAIYREVEAFKRK